MEEIALDSIAITKQLCYVIKKWNLYSWKSSFTGNLVKYLVFDGTGCLLLCWKVYFSGTSTSGIALILNPQMLLAGFFTLN